MRFVYVILAHKDPEQIKELVDLLEKDAVFIFHICKNAPDEVYNKFKGLLNKENHFFCKREKGNWGRFGIVQGTLNALYLLDNLNLKYDRVHLISGQDFPIKSEAFRNDFFNKNKDKEFIRNWKFYPIDENNLAENPWSISKHFQNKRLQHYYFVLLKTNIVVPEKYDLRYKELSFLKSLILFVKNLTKHSLDKKIILFIIQYFLTRILPFPRKIPNIQFYGGSQWWSITPKAVKYIIDFDKNDNYLKAFYKSTLLPDESYFQTVLLNSPLKNKVINNNLREIYFDNKSSHPKTLMEDDLIRFKANETSCFARKFVIPESNNLIKQIKEELL